MSFVEILVNIINGYLAVWEWFLSLFFFVNVEILRLFALSFVILNLNKLFAIRKPSIKWTISILYGLYCVLKIVPIRNFVIYFDISQIAVVLPYFAMLVLPAILSKTAFGQVYLHYFTICFYYILINSIWLYLIPTDGNLVYTWIFSGLVFLIAQLGDLI